MRKYSGIPELLEPSMAENEAYERWITLPELRHRFNKEMFDSPMMERTFHLNQRREKSPVSCP